MYWLPDNIHDALQIRAQHQCVIMAGGTDLYPMHGEVIHQLAICDLSKIKELQTICHGDDGVVIGAMTNWATIKQMAGGGQFNCLRAAAAEIGAHNIQTRATIGGNIMTASLAGDGIVALMTLNARVVVESLHGGARTIDLRDFITNYRKTALKNDEIISKIIIPTNHGFSSFRKLGARRYLVISIVMAGLWVDTDKHNIITDARLVVGACSAVAQNLPPITKKIIGQMRGKIADITIEDGDLSSLQPIDDVRASGEYRKFAVKQMIYDLLGDIGNANNS